jgi:hypothetical protein
MLLITISPVKKSLTVATQCGGSNRMGLLMKTLGKLLLTAVATLGIASTANAAITVSATAGCADYTTCGPLPITYDFDASTPIVLDTASIVGPGSTPGDFAQPLGSTGKYFSVGPSTVVHNNVTIGNDISSFSFIWGSLDAYNILTVATMGGFQSYTGADIAALIPGFADGDQTSPTSNPIVTIFLTGDNQQAVSFNMDSDTNAFEIDNIVVNSAATPTPEPATWAMMLLGFGGIGMAMRRKSQARLPQLA